MMDLKSEDEKRLTNAVVGGDVNDDEFADEARDFDQSVENRLRDLRIVGNSRGSGSEF